MKNLKIFPKKKALSDQMNPEDRFKLYTVDSKRTLKVQSLLGSFVGIPPSVNLA